MALRKNPFLLLFILVCANVAGRAQSTDSSYVDYLDQFRDYYKTRIMDDGNVQQIVDSFARNHLVTNERFAELTRALYSTQKNIGILLYFYKNGVLRRTFFEPGKLLSDDRIPITEKELIDLGRQMEEALRIPSLGAGRAPVPRGISKDSSSSRPVALAPIIARWTSLLLPPAFSEKYRHLIVIPALNIGSVPFHLLQPYHNGSYLIEKCSYTIAPTLIDFAGLRSQVLQVLGSNFTGLKNFDSAVVNNHITDPSKVHFTIERAVLVGNPAYPTDSPYVYPDLPGAAREVDSAAKLLAGARTFKGRRANKQAILNALNGADIAYFATHGVSSSSFRADDSYLVLSGPDPYLRTYEIMDQRRRPGYKAPELVILSACQTGLGAAVAAGIAGSIARGFIVGGSRHVVMSLWSVDDEATAYLMGRFLFYLQHCESFRPSEHLRQAALDTKAKYPNPVYWAGFSFFGVDYD